MFVYFFVILCLRGLQVKILNFIMRTKSKSFIMPTYGERDLALLEERVTIYILHLGRNI